MMKNRKITISILIVLFIGISFLTLFIGKPSEIVLINIRVPRFILTFLTGMILATVGNTYQMLLNNPLAEPYILGTSSGSALFAIAGYIFGFASFMPLFGFIGALIAVIIVWLIASKGGTVNTVKLVLSGIIVSMVCSAIISLFMYLYPNQINVILSTLMGSLNHVFTVIEWNIFLGLTVVSLILLGYLYFLTNSLNVVATGELTAHTLGVNVARLRKIIFIVTSALIAIVTSYAGIIGFVGLIIPHTVRLLFGDNLRNNYFVTMFVGGIFLLACDFIAYHISSVGELPVGIITTLIGSVFFIKMLRKR